MERTPNIAIVLSGGVGRRFSAQVPKQFVRLGGIPILERTLRVFASHEQIARIIIVSHADWLAETRSIAERACARTPYSIVSGGETRNDSTWAGICEINVSEADVLIHDAVRPFVSHDLIDRCLTALQDAQAVDTVIESADTIVSVSEGAIDDIPDRSRLRRGQTPQCFSLRTIRSAYQTARSAGAPEFSDDCAVVRWAYPDIRIAAVTGDERNIKLTTEFDLDIADRLLRDGGAGIGASDLGRAGGLGGRRVAIIGASSGIGRALTYAVRRRGGIPIAASRSLNGVDVRDPRAIERFLNQCDDRGESITDVVVTAGRLIVRSIVGADQNEMRDMIETNLYGQVMVAQAAYPFLRASSGSLLLFASSSFTRGRAQYALYSATKAAVVNLCQGLAEEWADEGIRVNAISPSRTLTPMRLEAFGSEDPDTLIPAARVADATADALMSPLTGQIFHVRHTGLPA